MRIVRAARKVGAQLARRRAAPEERILCCSSPTQKRPCATSQLTNSERSGFLDSLQPRRRPNRFGRGGAAAQIELGESPCSGCCSRGVFSRLLKRAKTKQPGRRAQSCPQKGTSAAFVGDRNSQRDLTEFTVPAGKITAKRAGDHPSLVYPFATFVKRRRSTSWRRDAPTASATTRSPLPILHHYE